MSQENVEIATRAIEVIRGRDRDAARNCFRADAEWHNTSAFPDRRTIVGPEAIVEFFGELFESFDTEGMEIDEIATGDACVVMGIRTWGSTQRSGVPLNVRWALVFNLQDEKIARVDVHGDYANALEAAGLSE